jgi:multidrug efflux pump subunit AcrA (membrane-fusion protein)
MIFSLRVISLLTFSMFAVLAGCRPAAKTPTPEIRPVRVMTVTKTAGGETVSVTGNVQAQTEVNLSFRIDGRMIQRNVNVGDVVKPGQVVATLNADNEENALQSARASLAAASAQLVEARNNYERYKTLLAQRFIAEAEFDRHAAILKTAQSAVDPRGAAGSHADQRFFVAGGFLDDDLFRLSLFYDAGNGYPGQRLRNTLEVLPALPRSRFDHRVNGTDMTSIHRRCEIHRFHDTQ